MAGASSLMAGRSGTRKRLSPGLHDGGGEDDGGLGEAALHGCDGAGVVRRRVVGEGNHGCAGTGWRGALSMPRTVVTWARCIEARSSTWSTTRRAALPASMKLASRFMTWLRPGQGAMVSEGAFGFGSGHRGGREPDAVRPSAGSVLVVEVIVIIEIVIVLVVRSVLRGRVVRVVVDRVCGREKVCEVDAFRGPRRRGGGWGGRRLSGCRSGGRERRGQQGKAASG